MLLGYFGESLEQPCGNCDTCDRGTASPRSTGSTGSSDAAPLHPGADAHHDRWGHGLVMSVEQDRVTVLFDEVGYRTLTRHSLDGDGAAKVLTIE